MAFQKKWQRRKYEQVALVAVRKARSIVLFWARQCRKSTNLGNIAWDEMSREPGRRVIAASVSLLAGTELVSKAISSAEQAALVAREAAAMQAALVNNAAESKNNVKLIAANSETGKTYDSLSADDFTDLYRTARLEMRLYFDSTTFSRLQVIAPNPATARGWTGTVLRDEVGFDARFREMEAAVGPIVDTDPTFRMVYASNLCPDDRHPYFEMTLPPPGVNLPVNPRGNFYVGATGKLIHRVSIADAYAAGHVLYNDRDGGAMSLQEAFAKASDKGAWNFNYALIHIFGGTAAIDFVALATAQARGRGECGLFYIESEADLDHGLEFLINHLGAGQVGIGFDVATTTNETSNPSSITVTEQKGTERIQRAVFIWKEKNAKVARARLRKVIIAISLRSSGGRARRLCIDASNETYFADETKDEFAVLIPTMLVKGGTSIEPPGYKEPTNMKTYLGDLYAAAFNDNHYTVPPEIYFKEDHRLMIKDRGIYNAVPQPDGKHGDTFDSGKLAEWALVNSAGAIVTPDGIRTGGGPGGQPWLPRLSARSLMR